MKVVIVLIGQVDLLDLAHQTSIRANGLEEATQVAGLGRAVCEFAVGEGGEEGVEGVSRRSDIVIM